MLLQETPLPQWGQTMHSTSESSSASYSVMTSVMFVYVEVTMRVSCSCQLVSVLLTAVDTHDAIRACQGDPVIDRVFIVSPLSYGHGVGAEIPYPGLMGLPLPYLSTGALGTSQCNLLMLWIILPAKLPQCTGHTERQVCVQCVGCVIHYS